LEAALLGRYREIIVNFVLLISIFAPQTSNFD